MAGHRQWLKMPTCFGGDSSIHPYRGDCSLENAVIVTTSNHVLAKTVDFEDDVKIKGDVMVSKRLQDDDDTSGG